MKIITHREVRQIYLNLIVFLGGHTVPQKIFVPQNKQWWKFMNISDQDEVDFTYWEFVFISFYLRDHKKSPWLRAKKVEKRKYSFFHLLSYEYTTEGNLLRNEKLCVEWNWTFIHNLNGKKKISFFKFPFVSHLMNSKIVQKSEMWKNEAKFEIKQK